MKDIMLGKNIQEDEDWFVETLKIVQDALNTIQEDSSFSIPLSFLICQNTSILSVNVSKAISILESIMIWGKLMLL